MGIIYKFTNKINGKAYIGQTTTNLNERINCHLYHVRKNSNIPFHNAIRKYSFENFEIKIIDHADDIHVLNEKEAFWIMNEKTLHPLGYNMTSGGDNYIRSEETKRRIGEKSKRPCAEETRKKIAASLKGRKRPEQSSIVSLRQLGRKLSEETKRKISEAHKGKKLSEETKKKLSEILKKRMNENSEFRTIALSNLNH